jgi:GcrA cell cycle regulator
MNGIGASDVRDERPAELEARQGDWTDDRVATLKRLWQAGMSASQVAQQLGGVTRSAVLGKIHRLGLPGRDLPTPPRKIAEHTPRIAKPRSRATDTPRPTARPMRTVTPPPPPVCLAPTASLLTLTLDACRWPIGDPGEAGFGFCGRLRDGHRLYCPDHVRLAFRPPTKPQKRVDQPLERLRAALAGADDEAPHRTWVSR